MYQGAVLRSKAANQLPATVRPQLRSIIKSPDVLASWAALGFEHDYELLKRGFCYTFTYRSCTVQVRSRILNCCFYC